jgi:GTP-binding protein
MEIKSAEFKGSFPSVSLCPSDNRPEFAFIGRSNVGKSSLINMLCKRKELAHTSQTPGKTQLINYFLINEDWYLVDLPGYGYARHSKVKRYEFQNMIYGYLSTRPNLYCAQVLVDSNIPPQKADIEFINKLGELSVPLVIVFTKLDRLSPTKRMENIELFKLELLKYWNEMPQYFLTSAEKGEGRKELLEFIHQVNSKVKR